MWLINDLWFTKPFTHVSTWNSWCKESHWAPGFLWDERASRVPRQLPLTAVCRVQTADRQVSVLHSNTNTSTQTELDLFICRTLSLARTKGNGVTSLHKDKETVLYECGVEKTTVASSELNCGPRFTELLFQSTVSEGTTTFFCLCVCQRKPMVVYQFRHS